MLAVAGIGATLLGVFVWRSAKKLVTDARQTLHEMFGESFPSLFTEEPDPRSARIAGIAFVAVGVVLLVVAVVLLVSSR